MGANGFHKLCADGHQRIETRCGVLKYEADVAARSRLAIRPIQLTGNVRIARQERGQGQRQRAFARTTFANDRQRFALPDIEIDILQRGLTAVGYGELLKADKGAHDSTSRRNMAFVSPSPAR